jgi:hypothetical protein
MIATPSMPPWKKVLAGIGAAYLIAMAAWCGYALLKNATTQTGATDLAAHPEQQDEILAQRRAADLRDKLDLTPEQAATVELLYRESAARIKAAAAAEDGQSNTMRGYFGERAKMQEALKQVLTPEQFDKYVASLPGGPNRGGSGGPGGPGDPGRMLERLKQEHPELAGRIADIEKLPEDKRREAIGALMREFRLDFGNRRPERAPQ